MNDANEVARFQAAIVKLSLPHVAAGRSPEEAIGLAIGEYQAALVKLRALYENAETHEAMITYTARKLWTELRGGAQS